MNKLRELIYNNIEGKRVLVFFVLANIFFVLMLGITIPMVMGYSGGIKLLDMMPMGYNFDYVQQLFTALGTDGRHAYLYYQIPLDMVYPLLFGISYCLVLAYFLAKFNRLKGALFYLCLLPLIVGLFDYFENIGTISMLVSYPELSNLSVSLTNIFTITKSMLTTIYFVVLIIVLAVFGFKALFNKK